MRDAFFIGAIFTGNSAGNSTGNCTGNSIGKRATNRIGKLFVMPLLKASLLFVLLLNGVWADECDLQQSAGTGNNTYQVSVKKVIDGDTVRLQDGRLVRFIGINTPEIDHEFGHSQPFAEQGRDFLRSIIEKQQGRIIIQYDVERHDRHKRLLAHVFTTDGTNVQAEMIRQGMGAWIVVPPNLKYMQCFRNMEQLARKQKKGVWGSLFLTPRETASLSDKDRGFQWMRGKIVRLGKGKKYIWLNFADDALPTSETGDHKVRSRVTLRIHKDDLHYFKDFPPQGYVNKAVAVKGWLSRYKNQLVMRLRHPASIEIAN